jgi:hypothetical protein
MEQWLQEIEEKGVWNGPIMPPLNTALGPWHEFYTLLGTASATMIGLQFVAATVGSGVFASSRRAALRVFLSASVVNFSTILAASLIVLAPVGNWVAFGALIAGCGIFGLTHSGLAWRDTLREGLITSIDTEDRVWYVALPILGYLLVAGSGVALSLQFEFGSAALAVSMGLLLLVALHNAWDITLWIITRRQQ